MLQLDLKCCRSTATCYNLVAGQAELQQPVAGQFCSSEAAGGRRGQNSRSSGKSSHAHGLNFNTELQHEGFLNNLQLVSLF